MRIYILPLLSMAIIGCGQGNSVSQSNEIVVEEEAAETAFNLSWYRLKYVGDTTAHFSDKEHFYVGTLWNYDNDLLSDDGPEFGLYTEYLDDTQTIEQDAKKLIAPVTIEFEEIRKSESTPAHQCEVDYDVSFLYKGQVIGMLRWQGTYRPLEDAECYEASDAWQAFQSEHIGPNVSTHGFSNNNPEKYGICTGPFGENCTIYKTAVLNEQGAIRYEARIVLN